MVAVQKKKLYYAEVFVLIVYMLAFMSLLVIPINLLRFHFNNGAITLIEIIVLGFYNTWTFLNFFQGKPVWQIILKSLLNIVVNFILFQVIANLVISWRM